MNQKEVLTQWEHQVLNVLNGAFSRQPHLRLPSSVHRVTPCDAAEAPKPKQCSRCASR